MSAVNSVCRSMNTGASAALLSSTVCLIAVAVLKCTHTQTSTSSGYDDFSITLKKASHSNVHDLSVSISSKHEDNSLLLQSSLIDTFTKTTEYEINSTNKICDLVVSEILLQCYLQ